MVINTLFVVVFGFLSILAIAVCWNFLRQGPGEIRRLRRQGWGLKSAANADLPRSDSGTTIADRAGVEFYAKAGRIKGYRRTRTISDGTV